MFTSGNIYSPVSLINHSLLLQYNLQVFGPISRLTIHISRKDMGMITFLPLLTEHVCLIQRAYATTSHASQKQHFLYSVKLQRPASACILI